MRDRTRSVRGSATVASLAIAAIVLSACGSSGESSAPRTGREIYVESCQTCHGRRGEGFVGPSLIDSATRYPDVADEIAVVTLGKGGMPAWDGRLSTEQIATVVEYIRATFRTPTTIVGPQLVTTTTAP